MPGGSFYDRTAVRCQLLFPWRVCEVFADVWGGLFTIIWQLSASSIPLAGYEGIRRY
jgi:hypothetical protein